ncbi:DUF4432 family protein [Paenibacillus sp. GCM10027629]|uniref:DUF4432 family protein n=1 Tax=Paenibacillus sp. GCM10027629 TaxID=3273414 RepID=UPI00363E919B
MKYRYRPQRNYGCRINDLYTYKGLDTVVLENDLVRISVLAGKGTDIYEYVYKPTGLDYMWLSSGGVQNPSEYLPTSPDPISTMIDYYSGGWQVVFPNGGPSSVYQGAQFGQHGEVLHMPWDWEIVEDTEERISVRFSVYTKKVPFHVTRTMTLERNSPSLWIEEEIENLCAFPQQYMWGQHLAYGKPFVEPGCRIRLPEGTLVVTESTDSPISPPGRVLRGEPQNWPITRAPNGTSTDLSVLPEMGAPSDICYLTNFKESAWYEIENPRLGIGFRVEWDAATLPYLWYWQEFGATTDYPWYGRHYNIGLEPFAGYPTWGLSEAIRNGSAGKIGPYEKKRLWLRTSPF